MVEYLKTKKGYFYKLKKNGEKKRISQEEYNKKNKTRKNKKMIGGTGEPIKKSDIMYKDDLVCILKPEVKKGIIVWSQFNQPKGMNSLCDLGLKTGKQLRDDGIDFGRTTIHPYIFFRAPYISRAIDYSSVENEIISSYEAKQIGPKVFIRVDPDNTYVFSSEIRATHPEHIEKSKKTLTAYLETIRKNAEILPTLYPLSEKKTQPAYNLYSSELVPVSNDGIEYTTVMYPLNSSPIERNSEILVSIPHLTPDYFVLCIP
jgi:hypothetical protein